VFFAALWLLIFLAGLLIPGGQLVAPPLLLCLTALFLPLDYAGYALDRRAISFRARRGWLRAHLPVMAGFGVAAFVTCLVPGLNLLMLPALVVAGTLLALRYPAQ
jgi:CysZ protein